MQIISLWSQDPINKCLSTSEGITENSNLENPGPNSSSNAQPDINFTMKSSSSLTTALISNRLRRERLIDLGLRAGIGSIPGSGTSNISSSNDSHLKTEPGSAKGRMLDRHHRERSRSQRQRMKSPCFHNFRRYMRF